MNEAGIHFDLLRQEMQHWEVREGLLTLVNDNGAAWVPDASFVFDALGYGTNTLHDVPNPSHDLPQVTFSKRGSKLSFDVTLDDASLFSLQPHATRLGQSLDCAGLPIPIPEHYVCSGTWTYFNDGYEEAVASLKDAGITSFGQITLSQYCRLVALSKVGLAPSIDGSLLDGKWQSTIIDEWVPLSLNASLYPYQEVGFKWLSYMSKQTNGCILGDEMGLGKTLQVIALLLARHEQGFGTSLVIVPVSLLENWRRELARFAPTLTVLVHHGPNRAGSYQTLGAFDVVVMSYGSAVSDLGMLMMKNWDVVVLDEAQNIKNPNSQRSITVKTIPRAFGVAVSGTPFENHILDVWSVMGFAEPKLLGERAAFTKLYPDTLEGAVNLERVVSPFILRRLVNEVANDLPERIDISVPLTLLDEEAGGYEEVRAAIMGSTAPEQASLSTLTHLRMYCTHPDVYKRDKPAGSSDPWMNSAKYQYFCSLIEQIKTRGEKVLVFTSFRKMIDIFSEDIPTRFGLKVLQIDGSTPPNLRQQIVDEFSSINGSAVLVLNPTAAGTGLNITSACNVIHYNLEWNPAKEDQATARAYRRGQDTTVFVYRLFYANTVEEAILERMTAKREMASSAIVGTRGDSADREDIIRALSMSPIGR